MCLCWGKSVGSQFGLVHEQTLLVGQCQPEIINYTKMWQIYTLPKDLYSWEQPVVSNDKDFLDVTQVNTFVDAAWFLKHIFLKDIVSVRRSRECYEHSVLVVSENVNNHKGIKCDSLSSMSFLHYHITSGAIIFFKAFCYVILSS